MVAGASCGPSDSGNARSGPEIFSGAGVVERITPSRQFVQIDHGDIPGYMDAMSMHFAVMDTALLAGITVADSVSFDLQVAIDGVAIVRIARHPR